MPVLVGHRGFPRRYPENTLIGLRAALDAGAAMVECDVQMTRDGGYAVIHDSDLKRTAGDDRSVFDLDLDVLQQVSVHCPERFGDRFLGETVPSLQQVLDLVTAYDTAQLLVEIKRESIERWGLTEVMDRLIAMIEPLSESCIIISFSDEAIGYVRKRSKLRTGWVMDDCNPDNQAKASQIQPDYLMGHISIIDCLSILWPGEWHWMLHGVESIEQVKQLGERGVDLVETDDIVGLLGAA